MKTAPPIHMGGAVCCCDQAFALLGVRFRRFLTVRQAVDVSGQQVNLVVALQLFLRRHLALTAVTDGLLQLSEARTVDERRDRKSVV